jgi:anti-sigma B factor antagonist
VFAVRIEVIDRTAICHIQGEADSYSAPALREAMVGLSAYRRVIVDLAGMPFIDSAGLGALIAGARRIHAANGAIVICSARRNVHRLLNAIGMDRVMPIVATVREASEVLDELCGSAPAALG